MEYIDIHPSAESPGYDIEINFFDLYYEKGFEWYRLVLLYKS